MVSYDDFAGLDIRVARVKDVERIPKSKKLYKLKIDIGEEERTIVAGIAEYYKENEIRGKRIVVLTNLEPKTVMGVKSQGMLLAAEDGEDVAVLVPDRDVKAGAKVR